ncbi:Pro-MCH [Oryzias melastigma]|uniref:Pro-MCH n=1 Tax=Oryzias melastigma TaxID=30732 RepID=A0A834C6S7_ORYME|nr:Pro-MCH [Oryzias melastigma]
MTKGCRRGHLIRYKNGRSTDAKSEQRNKTSDPTSQLLKIFTMRRSVMSVIFATVLFFDGYVPSAASPMANTEDGSIEQDAFTSLLTSEVTDNSLGEAEPITTTKARVPRVIVIAADPSLWRDLRVLHGGLSVYKRTADDNNQVLEHRNLAQQLNIPILRRDTMRCMVGRVYRPCWEV